MPLPTWGQLEKSSDDNERIEEAIARMIQDHDNNANAHGDTGQSLNDHKGQTTIDHPAKSVVTDKLPDDAVTPEKKKFNIFITSMDQGGVDKDISPGNSIDGGLYEGEFSIQSLSGENLCYAHSNLGRLPSNWLNENILLETICGAGTIANSDVKWKIGGEGFMLDNTLSDEQSFPAYGFYFDCGTSELYAFYFSDTGVQATKVIDYSADTDYRLKIKLIEGDLYYYINETLKHTETNPTFKSLVENEAGFFAGTDYHNDANGEPLFNVRSISYSQNNRF